MEKNSCIIGDKVTVYFENDSPLRDVEIIYIPWLRDDKNWIFKDEEGNLYYVIQFTKIMWVYPKQVEDIF